MVRKIQNRLKGSAPHRSPQAQTLKNSPKNLSKANGSAVLEPSPSYAVPHEQVGSESSAPLQAQGTVAKPSWVSDLLRELQREGAYLLPLRLFIGLGWLRAGLEKLFEPGWHTGAAFAELLNGQIEQGLVVFPFYQSFITSALEPNIALFSWLIIVGEVLAGLAILSGTFTNLALLAGMFMATNFILAGQVNPGAFYVVIQLILFIANVGAVLGVDYWLSKPLPYTIAVAQPKFQQTYRPSEKWSFLGLAGVSAFIACAVTPYIRDYSVSSVSDPAMILCVLALIAVFSFLIAYFRLQPVYQRRLGDIEQD